MYTKTIELPVEVVKDETGTPVSLIRDDECGERVHIPVEHIYFQEALRSSYQSYFRACTSIYAYKYKVRICLDKQVRTCLLINVIEDDSWILKV